MEIADRIFSLVKKNGLGQKDFAEAIGVAPSKVSEWKYGKSQSYNKRLPQIAEVLNTTTEYLLTGKSAPPIPDDAVIQIKGRHTLTADAVEVAFAYDDASPEIQAAVRRVLAIEERSFHVDPPPTGEAM